MTNSMVKVVDRNGNEWKLVVKKFGYNDYRITSGWIDVVKTWGLSLFDIVLFTVISQATLKMTMYGVHSLELIHPRSGMIPGNPIVLDDMDYETESQKEKDVVGEVKVEDVGTVPATVVKQQDVPVSVGVRCRCPDNPILVDVMDYESQTEDEDDYNDEDNENMADVSVCAKNQDAKECTVHKKISKKFNVPMEVVRMAGIRKTKKLLLKLEGGDVYERAVHVQKNGKNFKYVLVDWMSFCKENGLKVKQNVVVTFKADEGVMVVSKA